MPRRSNINPRNTCRRGRRFKRYINYSLNILPVKEGEEVDIVIDDVGSKGDGVARIGGFLIFVPKSKMGERLHVRIVSVHRNFAIAERIE